MTMNELAQAAGAAAFMLIGLLMVIDIIGDDDLCDDAEDDET